MNKKLIEELSNNPNIIAVIRLPITVDALHILTEAIERGMNLKTAVCSGNKNWLILETR